MRLRALFGPDLFAALLLALLAGTALAEGQQCALDGAALQEGETAMFYSQRSVARGQDCEAFAAPRRCTNGQLEGDSPYRYGKCTQLEAFLGVNVNRKPRALAPALLDRTGTTWIRANVDILAYRDQDGSNRPNLKWDYADWDRFKSAAEGAPRKAILNLMWDFRRHVGPLPLPDSPEERALFDWLDRHILDDLAPYVDILVTGNEPFVNTPKSNWQYQDAYGGIPLVVFYTRLSAHVHDYLVENGLRERVDLYIGAFTRLHTDRMQAQPAVQALLDHAETSPHIDGIDLHTHVANLNQIDKALDFANRHTTKPVIVSEFTFVWQMKKAVQRPDRLGRRFGARWGRDPDQPIGDYMECEVFGIGPDCRGNGPVSKAEWDDFFATRRWFIDHFILEADARFRAHGVRGATFGLTQSRPTKTQIKPNRPPWYMGFLFVPAAVAPSADGTVPENYQYLDDFRTIQQQRAQVPLH